MVILSLLTKSKHLRKKKKRTKWTGSVNKWGYPLNEINEMFYYYFIAFSLNWLQSWFSLVVTMTVSQSINYWQCTKNFCFCLLSLNELYQGYKEVSKSQRASSSNDYSKGYIDLMIKIGFLHTKFCWIFLLLPFTIVIVKVKANNFKNNSLGKSN